MNINLHVVIDGQSTETYSTPGDGSPRLYEGDGIYIFNVSRVLLKSDDGGYTFTSIFPTEAIRVFPMTQAENGKTIVSITRTSAPLRALRWQTSPETAGGWLSTIDALEDGSIPQDCIASDLGTVPILFGNQHQGSESRIERMEKTPPTGVFVPSDTGLSSDTIRITDLESEST